MSFVIVKNIKIVNYDLFVLLNILQCINSVSFDVLASAFLNVVVADIINTICIKKNTYFFYIVLNEKSIYLNNFKVL